MTPVYTFALGFAVGMLFVVAIIIGAIAYATRDDIPVPPRIDEVAP